ncbi:hypothetical protein Sango_2415100 [Sesamum angolense]|uniref:SWIM-type domain-containing protein n=1 Tax=Sesamum angolense TaxID=2727404 RepID=A0AAE2BJW0_9LAMI|nr:hypothetical protein Sango_2415100 [Sesamum angolense]
MNLLATPGLPPCSNTDYLASTSNPDFGAGTSNLDFGAEPTQSHTPLSENFIPNENDGEDPTADSFVNESDEASEPDEAEYPIPPEDGPDRVYDKETFAQRGAETSSEPTLPDLNTQRHFYRSIQFFQQTCPEIPADSVDVPNLRYAKFYNKSEGRLDKGMLFKTKEELMEAVQDHFIRHARREYYVTESSRTKWKVLCKHSTEGSLLASWLRISIKKVQPHYGRDKKQDVKAFAYLDAINKEKWTASHDGGWRCGILTTNMSECINGVLKGLAACLHAQQSASVVTRRQGRHGMNTHVVKIANRECSCGKWNQFGIPCSHAQKVCGAYNISAASMVKDYYDVMAYNNTYSKHFEPVQSEDYWDDPNSQLVHDPTIRTVTRPGRNQTTRIHNEMDWRQTRARQEAQQQQDSSIQENVP